MAATFLSFLADARASVARAPSPPVPLSLPLAIAPRRACCFVCSASRASAFCLFSLLLLVAAASSLATG